MTAALPDDVDSLTLRFVGAEEDGTPIHELRAAHVAQVLQGLVELSSDFGKAGAFGDGPGGSEVLVRPAQEGSFIIEVIRFAQDNWETATAMGVPSLGTVLWWATKSVRADVKDFDRLENGNVKVVWQDDTVDEIPARAWDALKKNKRRRKKQLRQIMTPLSDERISALEVTSEPEPAADEADAATQDATSFTLTRPDYNAARPEDEVTETHDVFETEARMSAIDFDDPTKWRVKTADEKRSATVEDEDFLRRVARGLAISQDDIFKLTVRRDTVVKNGRTTTTWTVLKVESHRKAARDNDD
ncbi:hypothetical protein [Modestobacter altitudinis]|uniref:hypothetical protein n=1 Tax=Modestobacter altitudinis TaxID=2213158 RepID=UPI00110D204E|nr:hypothetical protein [Modestobacter altitudinis]